MSDDNHTTCGCPHGQQCAPLVELQAESKRTNDAIGMVAFLIGVVSRIARAGTIAEAHTIAELAEQSIAEWHAGIWQPGPHDDPADWRRGE